MRFHVGRSVIVIGKPRYPTSEERDALSRLALAYGVRRDIQGVAKAVTNHANLSRDRKTDQAIGHVIGAVISAQHTDPDVVDRLAAGRGLAEAPKNLAITMARICVQSPEQLVDTVLADFHSVLSESPN